MTDHPTPVDHRRVGDLLWQAREQRGWSRTELSRCTGYSVAALAQIEAGERETEYRERQLFARALGMSGEIA